MSGKITSPVARFVARTTPRYYKKYKKVKNTYIHNCNVPPEPFKLITINPEKIKHLVQWRQYYWYHEYSGSIKGGDWDIKTDPLETNIKYRSLYNHFTYNTPWEKTDLYYKKKQAGRSGDEIKNSLARYDALYDDIKSRYKTSLEIPTADFLEEICVSIGRDGDIYSSHSGLHRLAIIKSIDIGTVPVRVMVRHKEWQEKRDRVYHYLSSNAQTNQLASIDTSHPDMNDIRQFKK